MKSGIVEIADIFVVNKSDREGADLFVNNLKKSAHTMQGTNRIPIVLKTSATSGDGIEMLIQEIEKHGQTEEALRKKIFLLTEKSYRLIQKKRMKDIDKFKLQEAVEKAFLVPQFNLYKFADSYSPVP